MLRIAPKLKKDPTNARVFFHQKTYYLKYKHEFIEVSFKGNINSGKNVTHKDV